MTMVSPAVFVYMNHAKETFEIYKRITGLPGNFGLVR